MTPEEFAQEHGLSVEEATYVLSRRRALAEPSNDRVERARSILAATQKRVGVHPVAVEGDGLAKEHDPDAVRGLNEFYVKEPGLKKGKFQQPVDEFNQDVEYDQGGEP